MQGIGPIYMAQQDQGIGLPMLVAVKVLHASLHGGPKEHRESLARSIIASAQRKSGGGLAHSGRLGSSCLPYALYQLQHSADCKAIRDELPSILANELWEVVEALIGTGAMASSLLALAPVLGVMDGKLRADQIQLCIAIGELAVNAEEELVKYDEMLSKEKEDEKKQHLKSAVLLASKPVEILARLCDTVAGLLAKAVPKAATPTRDMTFKEQIDHIRFLV